MFRAPIPYTNPLSRLERPARTAPSLVTVANRELRIANCDRPGRQIKSDVQRQFSRWETQDPITSVKPAPLRRRHLHHPLPPPSPIATSITHCHLHHPLPPPSPIATSITHCHHSFFHCHSSNDQCTSLPNTDATSINSRLPKYPPPPLPPIAISNSEDYHCRPYLRFGTTIIHCHHFYHFHHLGHFHKKIPTVLINPPPQPPA